LVYPTTNTIDFVTPSDNFFDELNPLFEQNTKTSIDKTNDTEFSIQNKTIPLLTKKNLTDNHLNTGFIFLTCGLILLLCTVSCHSLVKILEHKKIKNELQKTQNRNKCLKKKLHIYEKMYADRNVLTERRFSL